MLALAHVPSGTAAPVLQAVTQPASGLATIVSGKVRYTPGAGFLGKDSLTYSIGSGGKVSTAKVDVTVTFVSQELPTPIRVRQIANDAQLTAALADCLPGDHIVVRIMRAILMPKRPKHAFDRDTGGVHGQRIAFELLQLPGVAHALEGSVMVLDGVGGHPDLPL